MEELLTILREVGSLGLLAFVIWRAVPVFVSLRDAINENTSYLKHKNGSLEKHMDKQDGQMAGIMEALRDLKK